MAKKLDPLDEPAMTIDPEPWQSGSGALEDDPRGGNARSVNQVRERAGQLVEIQRPGPMIKNHLKGPQLEARKKAFLTTLAHTGVIAAAAAKAGLPKSTVVNWLKIDPAFAEAYQEALEVAADLLELEALRRATHGVAEAVWHKPKEGEPYIVGYNTKYSDSLLIALLKAKKPEQFRERYEVDHKAEGSGGVLVVPGVIPLEQWSLSALKSQEAYREDQENPES
jgi:hypothetical protein